MSTTRITSTPTISPVRHTDERGPDDYLPQRDARRTVADRACDAVDKTGQAERVAEARAWVNQDGRTASSKAGGTAEVGRPAATLPKPGPADLAIAARGTAPAWVSLGSLDVANLTGMSIALPAAEWDSLLAKAAYQKQSPTYRVTALAELLRARLTKPESFAQALSRTGGEALRQTADGDLQINPFAVRARAEWEQAQRGVAAFAADPSLQRSSAASTFEPEAPAGHGQAGDEGESAEGEGREQGDRDDQEDLPLADSERNREVVVLADKPAAFIPELEDDVTLLRNTTLPEDDEIRGALAAVVRDGALVQSSSALSIGTATDEGTSADASSSLGELLDAINDPSIPIEDLIFMLMMAMSESSEDKLRDKMEEASVQEKWETAREHADDAQADAETAAAALATAIENGASASDISLLQEQADETAEAAAKAATDLENTPEGGGKSSTILASEVQMLMQEWKQMNEMVSNLMKTMHEMAMSTIRNLR